MAWPMTHNLEIYRGDSAHWIFSLWLDEEKTQPADLTGVTAKATIRHQIKLSLPCTITSNQIEVALSAANSASLHSPQVGTFDLQLTYPAGEVKTVVVGDTIVRGGVTG